MKTTSNYRIALAIHLTVAALCMLAGSYCCLVAMLQPSGEAFDHALYQYGTLGWIGCWMLLPVYMLLMGWAADRADAKIRAEMERTGLSRASLAEYKAAGVTPNSIEEIADYEF